MTKAAFLLALGAIAILAATPAAACRDPSNERYLFWYGLPDLLPGEVAIEIDRAPLRQNFRSIYSGRYRVARVLVGAVEGETIRVQTETNTCARVLAAGSFQRLVLVGRLREAPGGEPPLLPRYMEYDDPIRIAAEARARALDTENQRPDH